jgi:hypothetical protein
MRPLLKCGIEVLNLSIYVSSQDFFYATDSEMRNTLYPLNLALTSPTNSGRSVGIVRWRTKATEFSFRQRDVPSRCLVCRQV